MLNPIYRPLNARFNSGETFDRVGRFFDVASPPGLVYFYARENWFICI